MVSTGAARAMPGIAAVLLAEDVPGHNNVGVARHDETLFAGAFLKPYGGAYTIRIGGEPFLERAAQLDPEVRAAITPMTQPKQWNSGTGAQMRSRAVAFSRRPI